MECMIKKIEEEKDDSDISESDSESGSAFLKMERDIVSSIGKDIITNIIIHNQAKLNDQLDLKNVILLDNQSTLDLIYNKKLTSKIKKSDKKISIQVNGRTLTIKYMARMPGYNYDTWFIKDEIANIISLKNMIRQYHVTYDSDDKINCTPRSICTPIHGVQDAQVRSSRVLSRRHKESGTNEHG